MIRGGWRGRLGGRELVKVWKLRGIRGVGGGWQGPVSRGSRRVAAIGEIAAFVGGVAVDEAPVAPVALVFDSGTAIVEALAGTSASKSAASKSCASRITASTTSTVVAAALVSAGRLTAPAASASSTAALTLRITGVRGYDLEDEGDEVIDVGSGGVWFCAVLVFHGNELVARGETVE